MNTAIAQPRFKRPDIRRLLAPSYEPIPASYWLTATICTFAILVCFGTARWVPWFVGQFYEAGMGGGNLLALPMIPILGLAFGVLVSSSVWLAMRWPWLALAVALLPMVATLMDPNGVGVNFGAFVALGSVILTSSWRRPVASVVTTVIAIALTAWWLATQPMAAPFGALIQLPGSARPGVGIAYAVAFMLVLLGGFGLRRSARREVQRRALASRAGAVEQQATVVAERARLSRDLHDVVAHHVSLIAVRAETAPYTHPDLGEGARGVLADIAADARLAMDELRGVLGILGRAADHPERSPQPAWADIWALVERSRTAGLEVGLDGDQSLPVGPTEGYVAYRVVQESLTNARKHAPGAAVAVRLSGTDRLVSVHVESALPDRTKPETGSGQGLAGMRERVEAVGGRLDAGPRGDRFVVEATLPTGGAR